VSKHNGILVTCTQDIGDARTRAHHTLPRLIKRVRERSCFERVLPECCHTQVLPHSPTRYHAA
jgi:hypothetical protein